MESLWVGLGTMLGTWTLVVLGGRKATHRLEEQVASLRTDLDVVMEHLGLRVRGTKNGAATVELGLARDVLPDDRDAARKAR